jgi:xanthine dehydrogenase accessory factor
MSDLISILETLVADVQAARPVALCVVLKTYGSAPQTPGALMLVRADASTIGTVGGGAVEAQVQRDAVRLLGENRSAMLNLSLEHDYHTDEGPICGGRMSVGVMPIADAAALKPFAHGLELVRQRRPARIPIIVEHEGQPLEYHLHLEVPPTLIIAGAGHVGQALARLAANLDFHTVVIDDRAEFASRERFGKRVRLVTDDIAEALRTYPIDEGCYVVIVTRGHLQDEQALQAVIQRPAGYIGMIGSKRKSATVLKALEQAGVPPELLERVHTPIGLAIGAVTVNEIAVSITAELIQVRRRSTPRAIEGPIEARL